MGRIKGRESFREVEILIITTPDPLSSPPTLPDGSYIVLNRSVRTSLGRANVPLSFPDNGFQPDILVVRKMGADHYRVQVIEAVSGTQDPATLRQRANGIMRSLQGQFPPETRIDISGTITI
jgi:hypothetical protein